MATLDRESKTPLHTQLSDVMRERIRAGQWKEDYRIPSQATLLAEFDVAPMTLRTALNTLRREGLIIGRQGAGTYVLPQSRRPVRDARELSAALVRAVRKLHSPAGSRPICVECVNEHGQYQEWPCRTEQAIAALIE